MRFWVMGKILYITIKYGDLKFYNIDIRLYKENGVVRSPYFIEGCYVVYSIKKWLSYIMGVS